MKWLWALARDGLAMHCDLGAATVSFDIADPVTYPGMYTNAASSQYLSIDIVTSDP